MPTDAAKDAQASQAGGEVAATDDLETARKAVEDTALIGGGLWLSYLFVLFYLGIAAGAVTHADLLLQAPVKLPFLNIELPLLAFFFLAPLLLLLAHAYTLVHLVLLARRVAQFNAIEGLSEASRRRLPSNIFVQFLGAPDEDRYDAFGLLLGAILWVTLVVAPIALYLLLEIQFLPYHSRWITSTSRLALILDLGLLWWLWRTILASRPRRRGARAWKTAAKMTAGALLTPLVVLFAWAVATIPGEWQEDHLPAKSALGWARERLFDGNVDRITRRRESLFSNTLVLPAFNVYEALKIDDPKKVEWKQTLLDLRGRDLNGAVFDAAILNKVDFSGAQLQGASLDNVQLQGASLVSAQLQGASLLNPQLQGASLDSAQLRGASLDGARLWRATLTNPVARGLFAPPGSVDWSPKILGDAWTDATYAELRRSIERAVPEGQNRDRALERVAILDCARKGGDLASCDPSAEPPNAVKEWRKMIEAASVDWAAYGKALATILGDLVCSNTLAPDRIYVLRGLLRSDLLREPETGAAISALAKRFTSSECPVSTALRAADKSAIAEALSRPQPK
jgi:Pentapeptide repeats (8 copies)